MQVYCTRCGHHFQVAGQGPVYCPSCGVLLGPAPPQPPGGEQPPPRSADPASGVPRYAPYGYVPPGYAPPAQGVPGYPPVYPAPPPAPGTLPLPQSPFPSYPSPYATGAASSPYGYSPALAAASVVAAKADRRLHRRAWMLRALLITLAVLLVATAGTALVMLGRAQQQSTQASASPTPEIRLPDGFVEFSDPSGIFACGVPANWEQVSSSSGTVTLAQFGDPAQQTTLTIQYAQDPTLDETAADDQALALLAGSYSGGKLTVKTKAANGNFAGETWAEEDATLTYVGTSRTVTLRVAALSAIHEVTTGNVTTRFIFTMLDVAPAASFETADARDFQVVQSSFVFEK